MASPVNVHVLVDLELTPNAGGHVKCWERFAESAADHPDINLTVHFSGVAARRKQLAQNVAYEIHTPVFSTRQIPFLGHVPDHTDMGKFHPRLARHLACADVIHTTDAFFAFTKTAERVAARKNIPLVHSVHTDSIAYSELFTRSMLEKYYFKNFLIDTLRIPQNVAAGMRAKLDKHQKACKHVLTSRAEDHAVAARNVAAERLTHLRLGMDRTLFNAGKANRSALNTRFSIPEHAFVIVFVGRLDEGKNIYVLIDAIENLIAKGMPVFLIAAGIGPAARVIETRLKNHAVCTGFVAPHEIGTIYASADFMVIPSYVETWSMVAAEALACGLPVIASAQSGVGRFIGDNVAGELVHENTAAAFAAAIEKAFVTKDNQQRRDAALRLAHTHFPSWGEALAQDLIPIWKKVRNI